MTRLNEGIAFHYTDTLQSANISRENSYDQTTEGKNDSVHIVLNITREIR